MRKILSLFTMVVFSMLAYIANAGNYAITVDDASKVMAFAFHEDYSQDLLALEDGENVFEFNDGDQLLINSMNPEEPIRKVLIDGEEMEDEWGDWFINLTDGMRIDIITMDELVEPEKAVFTIKVDQPEKVAAYYMQGAVDISLEAGEHEYEIGNYERVNIEPINPAEPIYRVLVNGVIIDGGAYNNWSIILEDGLYIEIIVEGEPEVEPTIPTCVITVDNASKVLAWISDDWTSPLALQDGDNTISFTEGAYMLIMSSDPETESVYRVLVDGIQVGEDNDYDYEVDLMDGMKIEIITTNEPVVDPTLPTCTINVDNASRVLAWISDDWTSPLALQDGDNTISFTEGAYMLIMSSDPETESVYRVLVDGVQEGEDNDYDYMIFLADGMKIEIQASEETSVESLDSCNAGLHIFNLNGTKVSSDVKSLENGIYVINGRKVIIRK